MENTISLDKRTSLKNSEIDLRKLENLYLDLEPKVPKSTKNAKLILPDGKEIELPILEGTMGPPMIDIRSLYSKTGYFTYDPGFTCTGSCSSQITFIDGEKGKLLYRGYKIQDLCENNDFVDTCYLLLFGELPSKLDKEKFEETLKSEMLINDKLTNFYKGFETNAHPMAIMVGIVGALSAFFNEGLDITNPLDRELAAIRIVAKMPMIAASAFRTSMGLPIVYPDKSLTFSENFLNMLYYDPMNKNYVVDKYLAKVLDILLIIQADHEQNASTATVRIASSSLANPYACIAAGISSLWGPLHGGANEAVLEMLDKIKTKDNIPSFIEKVKAKKELLMGFGHRVYKSYDPRAEIIKKVCHKTLEYLEMKDNPYIEIALELENVALKDDYFIKRNLYPNVDFYSGIVLNALGIPRNLFTVIFALARSIGWICQWREMMSESLNKIGRPRQLYVGRKERDYLDLQKRNDSYFTLSSLDLKPKKGFYINKP